MLLLTVSDHFDTFAPQNIDWPKYLFFTGKGGVGKTTMAAATAISLASSGQQVVLVSTDPASNLQDVFECALTNQPQPIQGVPGLAAANFDPNTAAADYRERVLAPYRGVLPPSAIANMAEQLSGSCTIEVAAFEEFAHFLTDAKIRRYYDHIIFDTAPTGHALRLLQLPGAWQAYLDENDRGASCLGQLSGLGAKKELYDQAVATLKNQRETSVLLVSRPSRAALIEAKHASDELKALGMAGQSLIINGYLTQPTDAASTAIFSQQQADLSLVSQLFATQTIYKVPLRAYNAMGIDRLKSVLAPVQPRIRVADRYPDAYADLDMLADTLVAQHKKLIFTMGKGGVGKTTIAVALAQKMAARQLTVRLATTDPADHLDFFKVTTPNILVSHIDTKQALLAYQTEVIQQAKQTAGSEQLDYIKEDLRSPCTQEIAVFRAFAAIVAQDDCDVVIIDTAPTGHTLLLLQSTQNYAREVQRTAGTVPQAIIDLLPKLQDPAQTEIVMVTLPETTPVYESMRLAADLDRAKMAHTWWVVNQSMVNQKLTNPLLQARAANEVPWLHKVAELSQQHFVVVPWQSDFEAAKLKI